MKKMLKYLIAIITMMIGSYSVAYALPGYLAVFNNTYGTSGTALDSCLLCHTAYPTVKTNLNSYAVSYRDNGHNFKTIELFDSDGDGGTNVAEINAKTFPGDSASKITVAATTNVPATVLPLPTMQQVITHPTIYQSPLVSANALDAMPFGFGSIAQGGNTVDLHISIGSLSAPADIYLAILMPADPNNVYLAKPDNTLQPLSNGLVPWMTHSGGGIDVSFFSNLPLSGLPAGTYTFAILLTPAPTTDFSDYYLWVSGFTVVPPSTSNPAPTPAATTTNGTTLYSQNCAACHGSLASSAKKNRTAAQIQGAINANTGNMGGLSSLTAAQVQAIATILAQQPATQLPTDGPSLYSQICAGCHFPLATSNIAGASASKIQSAITRNKGGVMASLGYLTSAQIQAIASVLPAGGND